MRIRHIAFVVSDKEKSASFYEDILQFRRLGLRQPGNFPGTAIDLTDGEVHFSLIQPHDDVERQQWAHGTYGPNHIGVEIADLEGVKQRLRARGIETIGDRMDDADASRLKYFKFIDPDGVEVDVSKSQPHVWRLS